MPRKKTAYEGFASIMSSVDPELFGPASGPPDERDVLGARPCPECECKAGWEPMGPYRAQCQGCGAVVKNSEAFG